MPNGGPVKTLAIRLDEQLHAQLSVVAQLSGITITDAIRQAIEDYVNAQRDNDALTAKAQAVLEEIDREAAARRSAIADLLSTAEPPPNPSKSRGRAAGKDR